MKPYSFVEGVHDTVDEVLGIAMGCFFSLDQGAQVVDPVELGAVHIVAREDTVDLVGALSEGLRQLAPNEISSLLSVEFDAVLELHELEVLLDVVAEAEDVGVLAADGHEFVLVQVPDLVVVALSQSRAHLHLHH